MFLMLYKCDEGTVFGEIQAMDLSSEGCCTSYLRELYFFNAGWSGPSLPLWGTCKKVQALWLVSTWSSSLFSYLKGCPKLWRRRYRWLFPECCLVFFLSWVVECTDDLKYVEEAPGVDPSDILLSNQICKLLGCFKTAYCGILWMILWR